ALTARRLVLIRNRSGPGWVMGPEPVRNRGRRHPFTGSRFRQYQQREKRGCGYCCQSLRVRAVADKRIPVLDPRQRSDQIGKKVGEAALPCRREWRSDQFSRTLRKQTGRGRPQQREYSQFGRMHDLARPPTRKNFIRLKPRQVLLEERVGLREPHRTR